MYSSFDLPWLLVIENSFPGRLFGFSCSFHFTNGVSPAVSSFRCMDCAAAPAQGLDCRTPIASIRSSIRSRSISQNFSAETRSRSGASTSAAPSRSVGWCCQRRERLFDFRSLRVDFVHLFSVIWFASGCSIGSAKSQSANRLSRIRL